MQSKTVVIAGAPTGCWTNVGDEAIFAGMLKGLREVEPDISIIVISSNPGETLARYGVTEVPYNDVTQIVRATRSSDLMILGGGSIFFDYWGFDPSKALTAGHEGLAFFAGFALLASLLKKPLMIYAVGVGPLLSEDGKRFTRFAFEQAQLSTVRDEESKALLQSLDIDIKTVTVTADPAFTLQASDENRAEEILEIEVGKDLSRPLVGVALRNWDLNVKPEIWERGVATALDKFVERHGGTVVFVPLHLSVDWPLTDDAGVAHRVMNRMKHKTNAVVLEGDYHSEEKAGVFQRCDLVLGMRLHSIIFAIQGAVPPVALSYDPKVSSALAGVGLQEYSVDLSSMTSNRLAALLEKAFKNRTRLRALLSRKRKTLADSARENARLATGIINEKKLRAPALSSVTAEFLKSPAIKRALKACDLHDAAEGLLSSFEKQEKVDAKADQPDDFGTTLEHAKQASTVRNEKSKSHRAPSHKREKARVACLTNRLLDWESQQPRIGGAERYCLMLGRLFEDLGLDITFYQAGNKAFNGDFFGFKVIALPFGEVFSEFQYGVCDAFFELSTDYEHVIYNMANYASGRVRDDALMICHGIWFDHDYFEPPFAFRTSEWFEHLYKAFNQPQRVVSVDANSINVIRSFWPELAGRMTYLPNCVDTSIFHPRARRKSGPVTIMFPRRTERIRGSHLFGPIVDRIPHDCRIWWVGDGDERDNELIRVVTRRDPRVTFYGASFEEMPGLYRKADICVIPTVGSEGTSLACLEALASGCAVVTTTIGGLPELVQDGANGILVDPDAGRIAAAINSLIEQPEERFRLQQAAVETARYFDTDLWRQRWVKVLEELNWIEPRILSRNSKETVELESETEIVPHAEQGANEGKMSEVQQTQNNLLKDSTLYDVICFSIIEWDFRYQRPQQIVSQFANQGHRVFYLSIYKQLPPGDKRYAINKLRDNVWEVQLATTEAIDIHTGKLPVDVARFLTEDLRSLRDGMEITRAVALVQFPTWATTAYAARDAFDWPIVYDCMDNWNTFPGMEALDDLIAQERKLVASADLLVVSSETLWEKWSPLNPNSVLARNAADFVHFHNPQPNDLLADASKPIVGYFGAIAEWFDIDLMIRMAKERPNYTFVVIGDAFRVEMNDLESLPNVRVLDVQPYEQMPAYLLHFDVCTVPFKVNKATEAMDVVKFYEYISQGKPVVAPRMRELLGYSSYLYLADDADDFIRKLDDAVQENDPNLRERRIELARQNTWQVRLTLIKAGIDRAHRNAMMTEILKGVAGLLQEPLEINAQEKGEGWVLKRLALHLQAGLAEREQAVQILNSRLTDREYKLKTLERESSLELTKRQQRIDGLEAWLAERGSFVSTQQAQIAEKEADALQLHNGALIDSLSSALNEKENATKKLSDQLAEKGQVIESLPALILEKKHLAGNPCLALRLPAGIEECRLVIRTTAFWPASAIVAAADEAEYIALENDPSFQGVTLVRLRDNSFGSFLRAAANAITDTAPASADVVVVDATRFDIKAALSAIKTTRDENPGAAIVSAVDFTGVSPPRNTVEPDIGASWLQRELWDEAAARVTELGTISECGADFAQTARQRLRAVVLAPISPITPAIAMSGEEKLSLGAVVLRQQESVVKRVRDSKGAVIFLPSMAWNTDFVQRPHHMARHFAELGYVSIFHTTSVQDELIGFKEIEPNLYLYYGPDAVIRTVPDPIIWAFTYNYQLSDGYPASARIFYDVIDDIEVFPGDAAVLEENHARALREADGAGAVSRRLLDQIIALRPDAIYLPNAVEAERFADDSVAVPDDPDIAALLQERKPIAGYYGVLAEWFDYELLGSVARSRPDWNFLLIGPAYDNSLQERGERLLDHPNVRWIGSRPYESLAAYLRLFDVALIPFVINNVTLSASPLKLYEYFAGGKPVITTPMPECESIPEAHIARNAEEFSQSLDLVRAKGLDKRYRKRVRALASKNSWVARAKTVIELLQSKAQDGTGPRRRPSADEAIHERYDPAQQALVGEEMVRLLSAQLAETQEVINARDNGITFLLARLTRMEKTVQARDGAVEWLSAKLSEQELKEQAFKTRATDADTLRGQLTDAEETVRVRDAALAWLQGELEESRKRSEALTGLNESLTARSMKWESAIEILSAELEESRKRSEALTGLNESLTARSMKWESTIEILSAELAKQQERVASLEAGLTEKEKALQLYVGRIKEQREIVRERNEGIEWLRGELEESAKKNQRSIGSSNFLKLQLAKNEAAIKGLDQQLSARDLELQRITRSLGWRLLSRYGRIKYRYLLPIYRKLNLLPAETRISPRQAASASLPAQATVEEPASIVAIEGPAVEENERIEDHPPEMERTQDSEESVQFDFYESVTLLPRLRQEEVAAILDKRPPAEPLHRQDVICFSIVDWETRYQRPQQIMSQFAACGHRVFYISTSRFLPADASPRVAVKQIKENVYEVQLAAARMPDVYGEVIVGDNKQALLDSLDELRSTHRINDAIGYTMIASWGAVALDAKQRWGWRTIYDCMDEWENFPGIKRGILDMEQRLVRDCDLLVVTAQRLWEKWEPFERPMVLARNGVDIDFYDKHYHPNSILSEMKHPVIGYYGAIADWFDLELVTHAAKARPDYTFVLLGGVFNLDVSELESLPNVRLLGQQPYETMPQYLYHFDICMIPFKINPITEATDPVKLYEYLSAGKPVVSVALSEVEDYGEYLYIAQGRDDFVAKLDAAVEEDDREMVLRRRKFAEQHTWQQRYKTIEEGIKLVTPRASVIIVTYNNLALNKLCLESLIRNTEYSNYQIIVVDNDSKDGTPAYLRYMAAQYPNISIILNETNNGFARANNQGIARSSGDYIVLLNNDTIVPPGWLSRLLRHLENSVVGMVGPLTNFVGNEAKLDVNYQTWGEMEDFASHHTWEHDGLSADIYMLAMFCVAFRRDTYDEIGPLDEQFGVGMFEDDDYTKRMKAKGYRVMCAADVFVHHFGQAAFKKLIENGSYDSLWDENRSYYETKWNVTWTPQKHVRLKFERLTHAPPERQAVGKKR